MKVLIMTLGTRGDVQPFVALAQGLTAAGHDVVLVAPQRFAEFVTSRGVCFAGVDDGPLRLMDEASSVFGDMAEHGLRAKLALARRMPAMFTTVLEDCWTVATDGPGHDADLIVHNGQIIAGQHVAESSPNRPCWHCRFPCTSRPASSRGQDRRCRCLVR